MTTRHLTAPVAPWVTPSFAVWLSGRPEATIRAWMRDGEVATACDMRTQRLLVNAGQVAELAVTRHHRPAARTRRPSVFALTRVGVT